MMADEQNLSLEMSWADGILVGPGLGTDEWAGENSIRSQFLLQNRMPISD